MLNLGLLRANALKQGTTGPSSNLSVNSIDAEVFKYIKNSDNLEVNYIRSPIFVDYRILSSTSIAPPLETLANQYYIFDLLQ